MDKKGSGMRFTQQQVDEYNKRRKFCCENIPGHIYGSNVKNDTKPILTNLVPQKTTDESKLNKTEHLFLVYLRTLYPCVRIQAITLKLGDDCRYTPDFYTIDPNGVVTLWEVKGFMRDDALVKIKVAARQWTEFQFKLVYRRNGQWEIEDVKP